MCVYAVRLAMQGVDTVTRSTDSTSILTQDGMQGAVKTRAMAAVLERHGFRTTLIERPFDEGFQPRAADDPCPNVRVDNLHARSQIEGRDFPFVVGAGIGDSAQDFGSIRLRTFPALRQAADLRVPGTARRVVDLD